MLAGAGPKGIFGGNCPAGAGRELPPPPLSKRDFQNAIVQRHDGLAIRHVCGTMDPPLGRLPKAPRGPHEGPTRVPRGPHLHGGARNPHHGRQGSQTVAVAAQFQVLASVDRLEAQYHAATSEVEVERLGGRVMALSSAHAGQFRLREEAERQVATGRSEALRAAGGHGLVGGAHPGARVEFDKATRLGSSHELDSPKNPPAIHPHMR